MHLTRLALTNFRNYSHLETELTPGLTLLHGNNAQGKTNLLEAIFYLATARSPHAGAERELIRWGASSEPIPFARVEAEASKRGDTQIHLEIVLVAARPLVGASAATAERSRPEPRPALGAVEDPVASQPRADENLTISNRVTKRIKVNGINKRALDLLGHLNVVLFLPEDLDLVFGAPSERRRYLDTTLSQIDPHYSRALSQYNQVVEQRNALLRDFRDRSFNPFELEAWDQKLIQAGAYIMARRAQAVADYNQLIADIHPRLTEKREQLQIVYQPTFPLHEAAPTHQMSLGLEQAPAPTEKIAAQFQQQLQVMRPRELGAAMTLVGPHRDDLRFYIEGVDMITYASRGQGRTIALSLKLAEMELMRAETGEEPILLLDDVMSELDRPRRAALSHAIQNASQAIVSCTDLDDFTEELVARARVLRVAEGRIENMESAAPAIDETESLAEPFDFVQTAGAPDEEVPGLSL